ncbi:hypothetical protein PG991_002059 [Apiospora marii]|uniref:Uncharacterized protein n=2 Tax=Apiospora marii TaxID=335849 RepID=A0ABR1SNS8_9PEZI
MLEAYRVMSERENKGVALMLPILQFVSEILWRCCYIFESFRAMAPSGGLGLNLLGEPVEGLIDFARKGRCYWPWLGPNIALDAFIFEQGILRENEPFDPQASYLVRMYGMGIRDLRFLQRNPNELERREQLDTLHRCHLLRSWLGQESSADLTEQLEFCYFSMAASMKYHIDGPQRLFPPGMEDHTQRVKARQREFKILKIMVDRIWQETERNEGRRRTPILLRRKCYAGTGEVIREGDWHLLETEEKRLLLGGRSQYHAQHPEHTRLLRQWLPTSVGSNPNCLLKSDKNLYYDLPLAPATPPPPCCGSCTCRGSGKNTAPDSALTTWMRVEPFINSKCSGAIYHAPNGLEEFMEVCNPSVLEKKDPSPAEVQQAELFSPRPKTAFDKLVEQEKQQMGL